MPARFRVDLERPMQKNPSITELMPILKVVACVTNATADGLAAFTQGAIIASA